MTTRMCIQLPTELDVKIGSTVLILRYGQYYDFNEWLELCRSLGLFKIIPDTSSEP